MTDKKWTWVEAIAADDLPEGCVQSVTCGHKRVCVTHHKGEFAALGQCIPRHSAAVS